MQRRKLITGLISFIASPAIVRASNLMPIKPIQSINQIEYWIADNRTEPWEWFIVPEWVYDEFNAAVTARHAQLAD